MSVTQWVVHNGQLFRRVHFKQYKDGLDFAMQVGRVAELKNHHPRLVINYLDVEVYLYTHDTQSITHKDKELALMIDQIIDEMNLD